MIGEKANNPPAKKEEGMFLLIDLQRTNILKAAKVRKVKISKLRYKVVFFRKGRAKREMRGA